MIRNKLICVLILGLISCFILRPSVVALAEDEAPKEPITRAELEQMAEGVALDNVLNDNLTLWRGGRLGEHNLLDALPSVNYGRKMPGFALRDIAGKRVILDRVEGPKLINLWATWCSPCIKEFPLLVETAGDEETPFTVISVNVWDTPEAIESFVEDFIEKEDPPEALHFLVAGDEVSDDLGVMAIPTSFLIDSEGIVHAVHVGNITEPVMEFLFAVAQGLE